MRIQECVPHLEVGWIVKDGVENIWKHNQMLFAMDIIPVQSWGLTGVLSRIAGIVG
jgi:hypothetical protein